MGIITVHTVRVVIPCFIWSSSSSASLSFLFRISDFGLHGCLWTSCLFWGHWRGLSWLHGVGLVYSLLAFSGLSDWIGANSCHPFRRSFETRFRSRKGSMRLGDQDWILTDARGMLELATRVQYVRTYTTTFSGDWDWDNWVYSKLTFWRRGECVYFIPPGSQICIRWYWGWMSSKRG